MFNAKSSIHNVLHYLKNKEMDELYVSVALRNLALAMIAIFVPIYMWTLGFRFPHIALFYIIDYGSAALLMPFSMMISAKIGIKKTMALGLLVSIFYYLAIEGIAGGFPYMAAALLGGISGSIYWAGFHFEFTKFSESNKEGMEISLINICAVGAASLSPLIGSLLISFQSFNATFVTVAVLLAMAIVPLFFTKDVKSEKPVIKLKAIILHESPVRGLPYVAEGMAFIGGSLLWPLMIYFALEDIVSLGSLMTGAYLFAIIIMYIAGKMADRNERRTLHFGTVFYAFSWIFRSLFLTLPGIIFNQAYATISSAFTNIPFHKIVYENAKIGNTANYFLFREFYMGIGRVGILLLAIVFQEIRVLFIITFFATFLYYIPFRKKPNP